MPTSHTQEMNLQRIPGFLIHDLDQPIILALDNVHLFTAKWRYKCRLQLEPNKVN